MATTQNFNYPSSSDVTVTGIGNPTGQPYPSSAVPIAGENPAGLLTPIQTNTAGDLLVVSSQFPGSTDNVNLTEVGGVAVSLGAKVSASSIPVVLASDEIVPISATALPLPAGASTSALQTTGNTSLSTIATNTTGVSTAANQAAGNSSLSTIASNTTNLIMTETAPGTAASFALTVQGNASGIAVPVSISGSTGISSINIAQYGGSATTLGIKASAASIPVVIASDQVVPVSATTLPLPAGASTSALQTTGNTSLAAIATSIAGATPAGTNTIGGTFAVTPTARTVTNAAITVGTTAVRLTVSGSAPSATRQVLVATPDSATTSTVTFYIGTSTVTNSGATRGIEIQLGQSFIANNDAGDYWIVSSVAAQTVTVMEQS